MCSSPLPEREACIATPLVVSLDDAAHRVKDVALLFEEQWPAWYGLDGPGSAANDLAACLDLSKRLPRCLFVEDENGAVIGTVSLREVSPGSDQFPGAWLTALLVVEPKRQQGVGGALVKAACEKAASLGFSELFAANGYSDGLFCALDWQHHGTTVSNGAALTLYRCALSKHA